MDFSWHTLRHGFVTAIVGGVLILTPVGGALEHSLGLSWLFNLRGPEQPPTDVLVVNIDESSAIRLDQPTKLREWDRKLHAELVRKLSERGATAIVFDVFFDQPRPDASDIAFAEEIYRAENVALVQKVARDRDGPVMIDRVVSPVPALASAATGLAPFPLPRQGERFGYFWAFYTGVDESPTLPVVALQLHVIGLYGYSNFIDLLKRAGVPNLISSPSQRLNWAELQSLMTSLHATLKSDRQPYANLRRRLAGTRNSSAVLALLDVYASGGIYYLNFYGPAGSIPTVQYSDFWRDAETQRKEGLLDLRGKTVFIGGAAQPSNIQVDGFLTVFSSDEGVDIGGVEMAATAFANLVEQRSVKPTSTLSTLAIVLLFGMTIAVAAGLVDGMRTALLTTALGAVYFGLAVYLFGESQVWLPLVTPIAIQLPFALSLAYLAQYMSARRAREKYSQAIRYYVPERVAKRFDRGQEPATRPEVVFGVCMSTDVQGYSTLAEQLPEDELSTLTTRYFEKLSDCVERRGGEVLEVRGDGMIAVWSTPTEDCTSSRQASQAALDILQAVRRLNSEDRSRQLPTRIGLHAGRVALGHVGGGGHLAFSVMGDSMNTAARIQELNKALGTRLLASSTVVRDLEGWLCRRVCRFQPRGQEKVISVYAVIGPYDVVTRGEIELNERFASASRLFEQGNWEEAARAFAEILRMHPDDGPSEFYLERCGAFIESPPLRGQEMIVSV